MSFLFPVGSHTMPSVFKTYTRIVVQELDAGGDMIAVRSILEADRLHCFCLVRKKRNFLGCRYYSTDLTLEDILEREESEGQFDELDSVFKGQYEVHVRWPASGQPPAPVSHPTFNYPLPTTKPTSQQRTCRICIDMFTHLSLRNAQKCCKGRWEQVKWKFIFLGNYS